MNSKKLKFSILMLLAVVFAVTCAFALTACGDDEASEIYIEKSNTPRVNYVQGQELDLSAGAITAVIDGEQNLVPLNSEDVTVTGYDANALGEQTLTVTYGGCTTTFKVNVIARMVAEGYTTKYFVGDTFDTAAGKIRLADDKASVTLIKLDDPRVTISNGTFNAAGDSTVTIKYTTDDATYECNVNVSVYAIGSVTMTPPEKKDYMSHDTALALEKGYLTVKSTGNDLTKYIDLSDARVTKSNYDFSAATPANRVTPLSQTVKVSFAGYDFTYGITILYSSMSVVADGLESVKNVDLNAVESAVATIVSGETTLGDVAVDAAMEYFKLAATEKATFDKAKLDKLMICATVYGYNLYKESLDSFSKIFRLEIKSGGSAEISFVFESAYTDAVSEMNKFNSATEPINFYAPMLRSIQSEFASLSITADKTAKDYILVHSAANHTMVSDLFNHFIEVYDLLADIDVNWADDPETYLTPYADDILIAVTRISGAGYSTYINLYNRVLSSWREKNDVMDILYYYFLYLEEDSDKFIRETMWKKVPLPVGMNDWYSAIITADARLLEILPKSGDDDDSYLLDVTEFMLARKRAYEACDNLKNSGNQFYVDLYDFLDGDYIYNHDLNTIGFYHINGSSVHSAQFNKVWEVYLELYELYTTEGFEFTDNEEYVVNVLDEFFALSPAEMYGFLCSLNYQYENARGSVMTLDYTYNAESGTIAAKNRFVAILADYFVTVLGDDADEMFKTLLNAIENYAIIGRKNNAVDDFKTAMESLAAMLVANPDKAAIFDEHLGDGYDIYLATYEATVAVGNIDLSGKGIAADLEKLLVLLDKLYAVENHLATLDPEEDKDEYRGSYLLFAGLCEYAFEHYDAIFEAAKTDDEIRYALYTNVYEILGKDLTLEQAITFTRNTLDKFMFFHYIIFTYTDTISKSYTVWEIYDGEIDELIKLYADLLYAAFVDDFSSIEEDYVVECIEAFLNPTNMQFNFINLLGGSAKFHGAYNEYFASLTEDTTTLNYAKKLTDAHIAYCVYFIARGEGVEEAKEAFKSAYEELVALDSTGVDTDFYNTYLKPIYDSITEHYEELDAPVGE